MKSKKLDSINVKLFFILSKKIIVSYKLKLFNNTKIYFIF